MGDIEFDLLTAPSDWNMARAIDIAEIPLIGGKPQLQFTGQKLTELKVELEFHYTFCTPEFEIKKLNDALNAHVPLELVMGNGQWIGWFVIQSIDAMTRQAGRDGQILAARVTVNLREGDGVVGQNTKPLAMRDNYTTLFTDAELAAFSYSAKDRPYPPKSPPGLLAQLNNAAQMVQLALSKINQAMQLYNTAKTFAKNPKLMLHHMGGLTSQIGGLLGENTPNFIGDIDKAFAATGNLRDLASTIIPNKGEKFGRHLAEITGTATLLHNDMSAYGPPMRRVSARVKSVPAGDAQAAAAAISQSDADMAAMSLINRRVAVNNAKLLARAASRMA